MKKKSILVLGILSAFALIFTSCNNKDHGLSSKNPRTVTIWHYYNGSQGLEFENLVAEFNDTVGREKGIIVYAESKSNIDELNSDLIDSVNKKVGADDLPNLFQCYQDTAIQIDEIQPLASFESYLSSEEKAAYIDSYMDEGVLGNSGELKLFPIAKSTEVLMLNKTDWDIFSAEANVKEENLKTWEGLMTVAEKYYDWSGGEAFFGRDAFANYMIVGAKQLGKEIFIVNDGKATLQVDKEVCKKLWDNFYIPYVKGYYVHVGRFRSDDIKLGKIIAQVCSTSSASYFPEEVTREGQASYPISFEVLPVPNFEGTQPMVVQQGASMAMSKSDEATEYGCVVFLKWFTEKEQNMRYALNSGYLPVMKSANSEEFIESYFDSEPDMLSDIESETIRTAFDEINHYTLYSNKGFENGSEARSILNSSMVNLAIKDREIITESIQNGADEEAVLKLYLSDDYFEKWFLELQKDLEAVLVQ